MEAARLTAVLRYCRLEEFAGDAGVEAQIEALYQAAVGYMTQAGVAEPEAGTPRRAQYDLCVNYLVLDGYDRRDMTITGTAVAENPAFRRLLNQLKMTEPPVSAEAQRNGLRQAPQEDAVSNLDTGAEV